MLNARQKYFRKCYYCQMFNHNSVTDLSVKDKSFRAHCCKCNGKSRANYSLCLANPIIIKNDEEPKQKTNFDN